MKLRPLNIYYTQDSIGNTFNNMCVHRNKLIGETLDDICEGRCRTDDIPTISVAFVAGRWRTADNRRLWVFRQLEILGKCDEISVKQIAFIPCFKQTSTNKGQSRNISGGNPGGKWYHVAEKAALNRPRSYASGSLPTSHAIALSGLSHQFAPRNLPQSIASRRMPHSYALGGLLQTNAGKYLDGLYGKRDLPRMSNKELFARGGISQSNAQRYVLEGKLENATGSLPKSKNPRFPLNLPLPGGLHHTRLGELFSQSSASERNLPFSDPGVLPKSYARGMSLMYAPRRVSHPYSRVGMSQSHASKGVLTSYAQGYQSRVPDIISKSPSEADLLQRTYPSGGRFETFEPKSLLQSYLQHLPKSSCERRSDSAVYCKIAGASAVLL